MNKILFVCHGNICRSPMAEFIMKQMVNEQGIAEDFYIESAATSCEEIGNPVYPPVRQLLKARGINSDNKRARRISHADYNNFDYIVCMDSSNLRSLKTMFPDDKGRKISKLLDLAGINRDVADPWYTRNFSQTEDDICIGCKALIEYILNA